jgi:signal peptidase I
MIKHILLFIAAFLLGMAAYGFLASPALGDVAMPTGMLGTFERDSPQDRISEDNILVYSDRVIIRIKDPQWASFADTNSMDPIIDAGANAIEIVPKTMADIQVGDIVSYKDGDSIVIHRVIEKKQDEQGEYLVMKGDNNPIADPGKVRFNQVQRVVVGIIY